MRSASPSAQPPRSTSKPVDSLNRTLQSSATKAARWKSARLRATARAAGTSAARSPTWAACRATTSRTSLRTAESTRASIPAERAGPGARAVRRQGLCRRLLHCHRESAPRRPRCIRHAHWPTARLGSACAGQRVRIRRLRGRLVHRRRSGLGRRQAIRRTGCNRYDGRAAEELATDCQRRSHCAGGVERHRLRSRRFHCDKRPAVQRHCRHRPAERPGRDS